MRPLSARERRMVAILVLVALVAMAWLLLVQPVVAGFAERAAEREELRARFAANERLIASIPRLTRLAEQQRRGVSRFVAAERGEAAIEALRLRLERAVEAVDGELRSVEPREVPEQVAAVAGPAGGAAAPLAEARVRLEARLTLPQLTQLLAALQNTPPYLLVDALSVSADQALVSNRVEPMDVTIDVALPLLAA